MKSLDYIQTHTLSDIRLTLGYTAVLAVAAAAYYEYRVGFKEAKLWSTLSVGVYFLLNASLYFWTNYVEGDIVYVGKKANTIVPFSYILACLRTD
jgi:signal peptidase complex subunit 2